MDTVFVYSVPSSSKSALKRGWDYVVITRLQKKVNVEEFVLGRSGAPGRRNIRKRETEGQASSKVQNSMMSQPPNLL
jgi:hypothetical protein